MGDSSFFFTLFASSDYMCVIFFICIILEHIITTVAYVFSARDGKNLSVMDIVRGPYRLFAPCSCHVRRFPCVRKFWTD